MIIITISDDLNPVNRIETTLHANIESDVIFNVVIMQNKLNWQALTNEIQIKVIDDVKNAILQSDGWIVNFNMFSDLSITLNIEIDKSNIMSLHKALSSILTLSELEFDKLEKGLNKGWLIYLNISFGKGKGDQKNEIPAVPG